MKNFLKPAALLALTVSAGCALMAGQDPAQMTGLFPKIAGLAASGDPQQQGGRNLPVLEGPMTLEKAVQLAQLNNKAIQRIHEEMYKAKGDRITAQSSALPQLNLSARYVRLDEAVTADFGGQTIKLRPEDSYGAELGITQAIFAGGQIYYSLKAAESAERLAFLGIMTAHQRVAFGTCISFYELVYAGENLMVARKNLALSAAHLDEVSKKLKQGVSSPFEELRAKAMVTNNEALVNQAKNKVSEKKLSLLRICGLPLETEFTIEGKLEYEPFEPDVQESLLAALFNRPDLAATAEAVILNDVAVKITRASLMPKVFAFFNAGWEKPSGKSFVAGGGSDYWNAGVSVSVPVFDGFAAHGKLMKGYASRKQAIWDRVDMLEEVNLEVRKAVLNISDAAQFVEAQKKNLELAAEAERLAEVGYKNGVNSQIDLLEAQNGLAKARYGLVQAVFAHALARATLHNARGDFLDTMIGRLDAEKEKEKEKDKEKNTDLPGGG